MHAQDWMRATSRYFQVLAPVIALGGYLLLGELWLLSVLALLPLATFLATPSAPARTHLPEQEDMLTGLLTRDGFENRLRAFFVRPVEGQTATALFLLEITGFAEIKTRHGEAAADAVLRQSAFRIRAALRQSDLIARVSESRMAICLSPAPSLDDEACLQLATRLQTALEEPVALPVASILPGWSFGIHRCSLTADSAELAFDRAAQALEDALRTGPSALRLFTPALGRRATRHRRIAEDAGHALDRDQIEAWFQPQISTDTGAVTGFEALARWNHPQLGLVPPYDFLPLLQKYGQSERLSDRMLQHALSNIRAWDDAGLCVPSIGVNFAAEELANPTLPDKISWTLDRFDLAPERLTVEILESVALGPGDSTVIDNVNHLAAMGCPIDLDDFGTGHTSISAMRRLSVSRVKIDRSFVTRIDQDGDQQRMVAAILTMCERLGLETLAEGIETPGEHAMLAQLGCTHVQGFGIARPMPAAETAPWIARHNTTLSPPPTIGRGTA
ncbi:MAG: bifunctional diguanylate cyclase/phosphodiesterase [Rhodobacteraceae bacterium]|nr:bifunctional diguanylate cyclase/phosphodiesterase [Paracoccaceae bacterium]